MKIQRSVSEVVRAGDIEVRLDYDVSGHLDELITWSVDGCSRGAVAIEEIERLAYIIQSRRLASGDERYVCGAHGYVREDSCEVCADDGRKAIK